MLLFFSRSPATTLHGDTYSARLFLHILRLLAKPGANPQCYLYTHKRTPSIQATQAATAATVAKARSTRLATKATTRPEAIESTSVATMRQQQADVWNSSPMSKAARGLSRSPALRKPVYEGKRSSDDEIELGWRKASVRSSSRFRKSTWTRDGLCWASRLL